MRTHALKIPVLDYRRFFRRHDLLLTQRPPSWNYGIIQDVSYFVI